MEKEMKKILIIEDDLSLQKVLKEKLESENFIVETAGNSDVAIEKYEKFNPHLILLDILLPGKSGVELLEIIRKKENESKNKVKVVIFSNIETFESVSKCLENDATTYYIKANTSLDTVVKTLKDSLKF
jgi:CheY-like chemotaxis protein